MVNFDKVNAGWETWTIPMVCTPILSSRGRGGGVKPPIKCSKRGGLTEPQFLEGSCWEQGGGLFQWGVAIFT